MMLGGYVDFNPRVKFKKGMEVPFVTMGDITPGRRWVYPSEARKAGGSGSKFNPGDILFARITPCLENGKIAQYAGNEPGMGSTEFFVLRAKDGLADPAFVYYFSLHPELRSVAEKSMAGASGRQRADISSLREFECEFPSLPTQKRIAGILSAYDDLIENNQRRIKILEEMARSLYREWFVHFRYPGHEGVPLVDSPLGPIPQGWEVKKLGDIAESVRRNIPKGQLAEVQPYVGLEHIPRRSLALNDWEVVDELGSNKLAFKKGEILFGKIRPYFHKVSVAPFEGLCSADTIVIHPKDSVDYALVVACVSSDEFVAHASATSNGAKMPRANWNVLAEYGVVIPPNNLAERFNKAFCALVNQQQVLISQNQNLRRSRDLLLPKLLSSQISLSEM